MNNIVSTCVDYVFSPEQTYLRKDLLEIFEEHRKSIHAQAGTSGVDILYVGLTTDDGHTLLHPDKPATMRGGPKVSPLRVMDSFKERVASYIRNQSVLEMNIRRASKTLTQLVRDMVTEQDLRDSLPDCLIEPSNLNHLVRTREMGFLIKERDPRVYASIQKDVAMIEGYINARTFL